MARTEKAAKTSSRNGDHDEPAITAADVLASVVGVVFDPVPASIKCEGFLVNQ